MLEEDARSFIKCIDEKLKLSHLDQEHHDVLVRLRAILEDDFTSDQM
jgi:hypothetical protein